MKSKKNLGIFIFMLITISFSFNSYIYTKEINYIFQFINDGYSSPNENLIDGNLDIFNEKWSDINTLTIKGMKHFYDLGGNMRTYLVRRLGILDYYYNNKQIKTYNFERKNSILASYLLLVGLFPPLNSKKLESNQVRLSESSYDYYKSDELFNELSLNALPNGMEVFPIKSFHPDDKTHGLTNPNKCQGVQKYIDFNRKNNKNTLQLMDLFQSSYKNELNFLDLNFNNENAHEKLLDICNVYTKGYNDNRNFEILNKFFLDKRKLFNDCNLLENNFIYDVVLGDENSLVARLTNTRFLKNLFDFLDKKIEAIIFQDNLDFYLKNIKENKKELNADYEEKFNLYAINKEAEKQARAINLNSKEILEKFALFSGSKMDMGSFVSFLNYTFSSPKLPIDESTTVFFELVQNKTLIDLHLHEKKDIVQDKFFTEDDFEIYIFFNRIKILTLKYKYFKNLSKANIIAEDFIDDFCKFETEDSIIYMVISIILFIISCILMLWVIKLWINYNKNKNDNRLLSEQEYEDEENNNNESNDEKNHNHNYNYKHNQNHDNENENDNDNYKYNYNYKK
jgi:hypothetical protein